MDAEETGRRVRAARAYAGFGRPALAEKLPFSVGTLWKIETGRRFATPGELWEIAKCCDVPLEFLTEPWPRDWGPPERRGFPPTYAIS